jgi:hypothetical protein
MMSTRLPISFAWPKDVELLAAGRAHADEDGVEALFEQGVQARDRRLVANLDAHVQDDLGLVVEHLGREAELGDVRSHQSAGLGELLEHDDLVAERHEVVGDSEPRGARADAGDSPAVLLGRDDGQALADVAPEVGGDALQSTDGYWAPVDAVAPAGRLAGPVAGAAEDAGEHVGLAIEHVGVVEAALSDKTYITGDIRMGRTCPLAVHDLVVIVWVLLVRGLHAASSFDTVPPEGYVRRMEPKSHCNRSSIGIFRPYLGLKSLIC